MKVVEPHVLKALIQQDLKLHPNSKSSDIKKRMQDFSIEDIRKYLKTLESENIISTAGIKKTKTYALAKKN